MVNPINIKDYFIEGVFINAYLTINAKKIDIIHASINEVEIDKYNDAGLITLLNNYFQRNIPTSELNY